MEKFLSFFKKTKFLFLYAFLAPIIMFAEDKLPENPTAETGAQNIQQYVAEIFKFAGFIIIPFATLMIIIGAYQYIASAGNPDGIQAAKRTLFAAIASVVLYFLSLALIKIIAPNVDLSIF